MSSKSKVFVMVLGVVCSSISGAGAAGLLYPVVGLVPSVAVMIVFVANISIITALAVIELRKKTRTYVAREVRATLAEMPVVSAQSTTDEMLLANSLSIRIDRLHSIPSLPVRYSSVAIGFAVAAVAIVAGVFQVLEYFK